MNSKLRSFLLLCFLTFYFSVTGQDSFNDSLQLMLEQSNTDSNRIHLLNELAWYHKSDKPNLALKFATQAQNLAENTKNQQGIANAIHSLGMINWYQGNYEQSSAYFFQALRIREIIQDSIGLARSYNNIGHFYSRQEDYEKAIDFYTNSYKIREVLKDSIGLVYSFNSIAEIYTKQQDQQALGYYQKAVEVAETIDDLRAKEFAYTKLGEYHLSMQSLKKAMEYFNLAMEINRHKENRYSLSQNLNNLASLYFQQDSLEKAINLSSQSLELSSQLDALELQSAATLLLSQAYAKSQDFEKAYDNNLKYNQYHTALLNSSSEKAIIEFQSKYESEMQKSVLLNQLLEKEKKVHRLKTSIYIIALTFIGILVVLLGTRYRSQIKVNKILQEKQKEIEQYNEHLQHSNSALERFAYIASHDLKEPLRTIGTYTSLLVKRNKSNNDPEVQEFVEFIVGNVKQMYQLLDDLLAYSKLSKGNQRPKEEVNMDKVLQTVIYSLDHLIKKTGASVQSVKLPVVNGIPSQMVQLMQNLISNAIKFNDNGAPSVEIGYKKELNQHSFWITDNGIGIEPEYQGKIFQIFKRLHKPKYQGTGIGLAICEKIVQQHNGKIDVKSEVGQGSTFHFTLED